MFWTAAARATSQDDYRSLFGFDNKIYIIFPLMHAWPAGEILSIKEDYGPYCGDETVVHSLCFSGGFRHNPRAVDLDTWFDNSAGHYPDEFFAVSVEERTTYPISWLDNPRRQK